MTEQADEILREMHRAYHVGGGECFDRYCPFERNLRPFAARLARAESEPQGIELVKQLRDAMGIADVARPDSPQAVWIETLAEVRKVLELLNELTARAQHAEARSASLRTELDSAAQSVIRLQEERDALRERIGAVPVAVGGLTDHERVDRLERLWVQVDKARQMGRVCPACCMVGEDANGSAYHDARCLVAEIAREVAQR